MSRRHIAAVGSDPITPYIPGKNNNNVYQAIDVYENPSLVNGELSFLGAGFVGTELAIYLKDLVSTPKSLKRSAI
jgi:pyruvate/2-oxoglutarate dehydrogenase complex dihydrolipoamide dehydrogenase (E3) component